MEYEWPDEGEEWDASDSGEDGLEEDDDATDPDWVSCQECGVEVYEDAVQCPHCGCYLSADTSVWSGRSWWWVWLGLIGVAAVIVVLSLGR